MTLAHDAELLRIWPELGKFAKAGPGTEQHHILESGWKVWLVVELDTHLRRFGFRRFNDRKMSWREFLDEAKRLASLVGLGDWPITTDNRRGWHECAFTQPAGQPAHPPEAA